MSTVNLMFGGALLFSKQKSFYMHAKIILDACSQILICTYS